MAEKLESITSEELRIKAKRYGIKFTKNTSDDTLLAKVETFEKKLNSSATTQARNNVRALKHVRVSPLNPLELSLPGKFFTLCNREIKMTKAVQFGKPIFLEQGMIDLLKSLKYVHVNSNVDTSGNGKPTSPKPTTEYRDAYSIEELHTPTEEEWKTDPKWKEMRRVKELVNASEVK